MTWLVWLIGAVVLVAAGVAVVLPRGRRQERGAAWSLVRNAVDKATISRDAARRDVPEADQFLARAERMLADGGGPNAARAAAGYARHADRLWREAR
ncbi:hypothetical protein GCM10027445_33680 [Amycolatopsis endophytica]|uniref:Uncharacterized protein n=1 Tax=Amycolatopsis endophytica TaxID=860233 RepID=A0A853B0W9_9PSEU|nr:DUF6403 family protein [Amycolatopsis endophytica]NYI88431.1 hypothetical protein [Amycolatopsis endophytica]